MKDGKYRSGSFKKAKKRGYKVANLKKKQVRRGKAGGKNVTKKQANAADKNVVQISDTKFVKGKGVMGPNGKPLTGKVQLASGKMAHYVNGRRVMAGGPKGGGGGGRGGSGGGGGYRAKTSADKTGKATYNPGGGTGKPRVSEPPNRRKSSSAQERKNEPPNRTKTNSDSRKKSKDSKKKKSSSRFSQGGGGLVGSGKGNKGVDTSFALSGFKSLPKFRLK